MGHVYPEGSESSLEFITSPKAIIVSIVQSKVVSQPNQGPEGARTQLNLYQSLGK